MEGNSGWGGKKDVVTKNVAFIETHRMRIFLADTFQLSV